MSSIGLTVAQLESHESQDSIVLTSATTTKTSPPPFNTENSLFSSDFLAPPSASSANTFQSASISSNLVGLREASFARTETQNSVNSLSSYDSLPSQISQVSSGMGEDEARPSDESFFQVAVGAEQTITPCPDNPIPTPKTMFFVGNPTPGAISDRLNRSPTLSRTSSGNSVVSARTLAASIHRNQRIFHTPTADLEQSLAFDAKAEEPNINYLFEIERNNVNHYLGIVQRFSDNEKPVGKEIEDYSFACFRALHHLNRLVYFCEILLGEIELEKIPGNLRPIADLPDQVSMVNFKKGLLVDIKKIQQFIDQPRDLLTAIELEGLQARAFLRELQQPVSEQNTIQQVKYYNCSCIKAIYHFRKILYFDNILLGVIKPEQTPANLRVTSGVSVNLKHIEERVEAICELVKNLQIRKQQSDSLILSYYRQRPGLVRESFSEEENQDEVTYYSPPEIRL